MYVRVVRNNKIGQTDECLFVDEENLPRYQNLLLTLEQSLQASQGASAPLIGRPLSFPPHHQPF